MRAGRIAALGLALIAAIAGGTGLSAHRYDEYLQAARLAVEPGRVELHLDLTPGIAVADGVIAEIDRNRDGALSAAETRAYASRVLGAMELALDGRRLALQPIASTAPDVGALRRGEGILRFRSAAVLRQVSDGRHTLVFRNTFRRDISAYLANALAPESEAVTITAQRRDPDQRELTVLYTQQGGAGVHLPLGLVVAIGVAIAAGLAGSYLSAARQEGHRPELGKRESQNR